jgi:hypothetical protein
MTTPERAPRCLRLVVDKHGKNQCTSEQLPGAELCAHHLAEAVADFKRLTGQADDAK